MNRITGNPNISRKPQFGYRTLDKPCAEPPGQYYHFTTAQAWRKIQETSSLVPNQPTEEDVRGIFTVDADNLRTHWSIPSPRRGSPLASLVEGIRRLHQSPDIVLLEIKTGLPGGLPVMVRDNKHLFKSHPDKEAFKASIRPLSEFLAAANNRTLPEFIITEPVDMDRIRWVGTFKTGRFRIKQREILSLLFDEASLAGVPKVINTFLAALRGELQAD